MEIVKKKPMVQIGTRISADMRERAKKLANQNNVSEGEIYRAIIVSFFDATVNKTETKSYTSDS